jgi:hypothetical protein
VTFDRFHPDRWSGVLGLVWQIPKDSPVAIGAGRLTIRRWKEGRDRRVKIAGKMRIIPAEEKEEVLVEIVRRGNMPVLPGSSLKGAVRQAYELLTPSCDPHDRHGRCQVAQDEARPTVCPACSLFGGLGLTGRLAFLEAAPVPKSCWILPVAAARGWRPREPVPATYRVYGNGRARDRDGAVMPRDERTWAVYGNFSSRLRIKDATDDELGLLFAALGIGAEAPPGIRIGGRKFDGFGACEVTVAEATQRRPAVGHRSGTDAQSWAHRLAVDALGSAPERQRAFSDLHRALQGDGETHDLPS